MEIIDDKKWSEVSANIEEKIKQNKSKSKKAELDSEHIQKSEPVKKSL